MNLRTTVRTEIRDLHRGVHEFEKKSHQLRSQVKAEKGDVHVHLCSILNRLKNHFCQLLNVDGATPGWTEIPLAKPLVLDPSDFEVDTTIEKLKRNNHILIKFQQN
jgi:hypothetical protein